jgi:crotonobetainyl-CoA:carnitine CoA-transferase CaiB-like acyl-CoA transferase
MLMPSHDDTTPRPLAGIKVLDLSRALSGPFCTMTLGDLGATVIKAEPSLGGDMTRGWGPFAAGQSVYYMSANRSKQSLAIDFRHPRAVGVLRRLARASHVLIENFRPGVADEMGLDYATLSADNPALVYASISGFGSTGPARDHPGFDQIAQGHAGLMSLTGDVSPTRVGVAIGDMTAGLWTALGIVAALRTSEATGRGERIETSLLASLVSLLGVQGQRFLSTGEVPERTGNANPVIAPYGTFEASDGPINVAPATEAMWHSLCEQMALPELTGDPLFATNADRVAHRAQLNAVLQARMRERPRAEWVARFVAAGIPAGLINDLSQVFADPQVIHCQMVRQAVHPVLGEIAQLSLPLKFESVDVQAPLAAPPVLGQDTRVAMRGCGFTQEEIDALIQEGVVAQRDASAAAV